MNIDNEITPNFLKDCLPKINKKVSRPEIKQYDEKVDDIGNFVFLV